MVAATMRFAAAAFPGCADRHSIMFLDDGVTPRRRDRTKSCQSRIIAQGEFGEGSVVVASRNPKAVRKTVHAKVLYARSSLLGSSHFNTTLHLHTTAVTTA